MEEIKLTAFVDFGAKNYTRDVVIRAVKVGFGLDCLTSVVRSENGYLLSFATPDDVEEFINRGIEVEGESFEAVSVLKRNIVVNFHDVPSFVTDDALKCKLADLKCILKSKITWRKPDGIYDGTRSVKLELPEGASSLPYTIKLKDVLGRDSFYKVRHIAQGRVCNGCLAANHIYKDCPQFVCRKCNKQGHVARLCPTSAAKPTEVEAAETERDTVYRLEAKAKPAEVAIAMAEIESPNRPVTTVTPPGFVGVGAPMEFDDPAFPPIEAPEKYTQFFGGESFIAPSPYSAIATSSHGSTLGKGNKHSLSSTESDDLQKKTRSRRNAKPNIPLVRARSQSNDRSILNKNAAASNGEPGTITFSGHGSTDHQS